METIAITLATQVEAEGFCRPETLLFTRGQESLIDFEQRVFQSLLSHRMVQEVREDKYGMDLSLYVSMVGSLQPTWMLLMRRFLKKSFKRYRTPLADNWVH